MNPSPLPTHNFVQSALHRSLRAWQSAPRRSQSLFNTLLYFRAPAAAFGKPSVELIEENFARLEAVITQAAVQPRHAEVLQRRFKSGDSTQQIAFDWHCSPDQVNRLQREAIQNLALWLHSQEQALRNREQSRLLAKLPASSYSLLVGRQPQVDELVSLLKQTEGPGVVAITGLGGLGKTALADAAVRQLIVDWAFENVVWLRIHGDEEKASWQAIQERLAQQLLPSYMPGSHFEAELLQRLKQHPHLVILDNLEAEVAQDWLGALQAFCHPSKFLLTHRRLPAALHDVRVIQLEEFSQAQAEEFLRNHLQLRGVTEANQEAQPLADILAYTGGNPLALKLVAGLLHSLSLASVLAALRNASSDRTEALYKTIYEIAWDTLSPAARNLLLTFVLVGEEGASLAHLEAVDGLSERQRHDALQQLTALSLLELRGATRQPRYGVHRLTQTFLLAYLRNAPKKDRQQQKRRAANLRFWIRTLQADPAHEIEEGNLARALQSGLASPALWPDCLELLGKLFPHLRSKAAAVRWIEFYQQAIQAKPSQAAPLARLHNQLGALAWLVEDYPRASASFAEALKLAAHPGHQQTALVGICLCHWAEGEHSQAAQQAQAAQDLAPADPRLRALRGLVSYSRGHFRAAEKHFTRALSLLGRGRSTALHVQLRIQRGLCQQMAGQLSQALKQYGLAMDRLQSMPGNQRESAHLELLRSAAFFQLDDLENGNACLQRALRYAPLVEETSSQSYFVSSLGRLSLQALPTSRRKATHKPEMVLNPLGLLRMEDFE